MTIAVQCFTCQRTYKVKAEHAGRRVACPNCKSVLVVPQPQASPSQDPFSDLGQLPQSTELQQPSMPAFAPAKRVGQKKAWYLRHWHWLAVLAVLLIAIIPKVGLVIAGLVALGGGLMAVVGGVFPFLRILFGAPGTVLLMLVSRRARFEMMEQPDNHPYKVLSRTAFDPTRGLFWRGVLLMFTFIPAAFINSAAGEIFRRGGGDVAEAPAFSGGHIGHHAAQHGGNNALPSANPHDPAQFRPGPGGLPPGMAGGAAGVQEAQGQNRPATDASDVQYVSIIFRKYSGAGPVSEAIKSGLEKLPGYLPDSAKVDEAALSAVFQHRGRLDMPQIARAMGPQGLQGFSVNASSDPP